MLWMLLCSLDLIGHLINVNQEDKKEERKHGQNNIDRSNLCLLLMLLQITIHTFYLCMTSVIVVKTWKFSPHVNTEFLIKLKYLQLRTK
jgi:hypothetical protein